MPTNNTGGTPARGFVVDNNLVTASSNGTWTVTEVPVNSGGRASSMMEEVLRQARETAMRRNTPPISRDEFVDNSVDIFDEVEAPSMPMPLDCEILKKRHLNKNERQAYHKPKRDWELTNKGEVCKSACSLVVDDLVE